MEELMLLALHLHPLTPNADFILHLGDKAKPGRNMPVITSGIDLSPGECGMPGLSPN